MRTISLEGLRFIEQWEELVLYVYDDKVPKRRINGVRKYPEWDGSEVRGTLTIGYGHTDAAGWPKIKQGMRINSVRADEILEEDLKDCIAAVNRVKLPLTQHEFDTLVSFTFNCGAGNLNKLLRPCTASNYKTLVPRRLMQFVTSRGERMQGLVNRRSAEVKMWGTYDEEGAEEELALPSTAERENPPKKMIDSKTGNVAIVTGAAGSGITATTFQDTLSKITDTGSQFKELGVMDYLGQVIHQPIFWVGVLLVLCGGWVYWDRHRKLIEDHV